MHARHAQTTFFAAIVIFSLSTGCAGRGGGGTGAGNGNTTGTGGGAGGSTGTGSGGSGAIPMPTAAGLGVFDPTACMAGTPSVGSGPMRRLSRVEYNNMVTDLLKLQAQDADTHLADQFVSEQKIPGNFNTNAYAGISGTLMNQQYLQAAETLASDTVTDSNKLTALLNGVPGGACGTRNAGCAQAFIASFAGRAFRGQLDDTESAALLQLYNDVAAQFDFATGIQAVITAVLTSPRFLYVLEFGQPGAGGGAVVPLTQMELATRLALYLWRSLPDQALIDAAKAGTLDVAAQAARMLNDTKAATGALQDFANQWLDIENMDAVTKDTQITYWTSDFAKELHQETLTTFSSSILTDNTDLGTLLTSSSSYVNSDLASFYSTGMPGTSHAGGYTKMPVGSASAPRTGILTQGSVLSAHAHTSLPSPVLRGRLVRQQVLCEQVPDPPAQINGVPIPPPPTNITTGTTRDKYMQHFTGKGACETCHQYMDWIGFGFDNYDTGGKWITQENGTNVDPSGKFVAMNGAGDLSSTFTNAADMIGQLAASPQVDQCFALQQMRYALGRVESTADACSAQQVYQAFSSGQLNLKQLLIAVVSSDSFKYRAASDAGSACQ